MLLTIAWRNIWRNRRRSVIVLVSIVVGIAAVMFNDGLSIGMIRQMLENSIGSHVSHIQIHAQGFNDNRVIQNVVPKPAEVESALRNTAGVQHWSPRVLSFGLLSSALNSSGGVIVGVDPEREKDVTTIRRSIVEGNYLTGAAHEVVIGNRLADKLNVGIGDKVVGMASALSGDVGSDLFRVAGIFETVSSEFDKAYMFTSIDNARSMLELEDRILEYAVIVRDINRVEAVAAELRQKLGDDYEVLTYIDLLPILVSQVDMYKSMMYVVYLIIAIAMIFGIVNTMLMSVFERIQEIGVLMAIGMSVRRIFAMVLIEAGTLGIIGTATGLALGTGLLLLFSSIGIDFSIFSEGLTSFGVGAVIYPRLTLDTVLNVLIIIPLTTVLGAVYPAVRAMRLQPVTAIRYV
ncbi:MAG: FtsX-like permease family protein [Bacteroidota bacterium]|nr:FtsX-like permease family protein [Bacteroidota bacterium]